MAAADLLARAYLSPHLWPIVIPAALPPLAVICGIASLLLGLFTSISDFSLYQVVDLFTSFVSR